MKSKIEAASVVWDKTGTPSSERFDDPYFSREDGLAESTHVFLEPNRLAQRFSELGKTDCFVVAETGFGTGLNFLLTWRCFKQHAPASARLIYISVEGFPLRPEDLHRALKQWPELKFYASKLENLYPPLVPGHHWRNADAQVSLHLIFDQLEPALQSLHPQITHHSWNSAVPPVNAWFLDGFAPAKNPDMWRDSIYPSIARLSSSDTSLSSFTAAGDVRRNLQQWGFEVNKVEGFGTKREMIRAEFKQDWQPDTEQIRAHADKGTQTWHLPVAVQSKPEEVCILGAGIAGLTLAKSLASRGIKVQIFDRHKQALAGASGNPQAAIFGRLSPDSGDLEDFVLQSLAYSADFYEEFWRTDCGTNSGLLQLARNPNEFNKMQDIINNLPESNGLVELVASRDTKDLCGLDLNADGLWFPKSGWISPPKLAKHILQHPLIQFTGGIDLSPVEDGNHWIIQDQSGSNLHRSETVVICAGAEANTNPMLDWLPIKPVAGQLSLVPATAETEGLTAILSQSTSILPALAGIHCLGGTYRLGESDLDVREEDHQKNLANIGRMLDINLSPKVISARVGVRATTPDYLPICGPATNIAELKTDFAALAKDAKTPMHKLAPAHRGLFLNLGYGSRGYAYAPLCAEHLVSVLCGESSPLPNHLQRAVHPARFPIRDIIRGKA
mgnify:CR=1 FL=1|jgi:tRNA 5-methylaminomethyl-2-thiouridine biosynthesis bifunctional protein